MGLQQWNIDLQVRVGYDDEEVKPYVAYVIESNQPEKFYEGEGLLDPLLEAGAEIERIVEEETRRARRKRK